MFYIYKKKHMKKDIMSGVVRANFELVDEAFAKVQDAILELIDNAIDADATVTNVVLDKENNKFECADNGSGMTREKLVCFKSNFISTMGKKSGNPIGIYGMGAKCAFIRLSNHAIGSTTSIETWTNKHSVSRADFYMNDRDENSFLNPKLYDEYQNPNLPSDSGTIISISNIKGIKKGSQWLNDIRKEIAKKYSYLSSIKPLEITVNGEKLNFGIDRMHLGELGDNITKDGNYQVGSNFSFVVRYKKFFNVHDKNSSITVPIIGLYLNKDYIKRCTNEGINETDFDFGGIYAIKGGRYVVNGLKDDVTYDKMFATRGGKGCIRIAIDASGNETVLGLTKNKSKGINLDSEELGCYLDEDGKSLKDIIGYFSHKLRQLNMYQTTGSANRPITQKILDAAFNNEFGKSKLINLYEYNGGGTSENHDDSLEMNIALGNDNENVTFDDIVRSGEDIANEINEERAKKLVKIGYKKNRTTGHTEATIVDSPLKKDVAEFLGIFWTIFYGKKNKNRVTFDESINETTLYCIENGKCETLLN